jgi:hypothetical protein
LWTASNVRVEKYDAPERRLERGGRVRYDYEHLTIDDHIALGNTLKAAWEATGRVYPAFRKSDRAYKAAKRTEKALLSLQSALDDAVCALVKQARDPRHLATKVYYGKPFIKSAEHADPHDAFTGWTQP